MRSINVLFVMVIFFKIFSSIISKNSKKNERSMELNREKDDTSPNLQRKYRDDENQNNKNDIDNDHTKKSSSIILVSNDKLSRIDGMLTHEDKYEIIDLVELNKHSKAVRKVIKHSGCTLQEAKRYINKLNGIYDQ